MVLGIGKCKDIFRGEFCLIVGRGRLGDMW